MKPLLPLSVVLLFALVVVLIVLLPDQSIEPGADVRGNLLLIPASATMVTAWDLPRNPATDSTVAASPQSEQIRRGFELFMNTSQKAPLLSRNKLSCNNCHLNGGQKEKAMPLVGVATVYPEYNKRAGRLFTLEDRIVGCFMRSQDGTREMSERNEAMPLTRRQEVLALSAYIMWLSEGYTRGESLPWRGHNVIQSENLIPVAMLDPARGERLFLEKCSSCHGEDGQGVEIGDKKAGPLWGPDSWNDGAGAARIYTLAGMIRYAMPYLDPGSLSDEEAQHIAAFITSKPRPAFPFKKEDYRKEQLPVDAVYYTK